MYILIAAVTGLVGWGGFLPRCRGWATANERKKLADRLGSADRLDPDSAVNGGGAAGGARRLEHRPPADGHQRPARRGMAAMPVLPGP